MKRKLLIMLFACIAACVIFTGCGNAIASSDAAQNTQGSSEDVEEMSVDTDEDEYLT